MAKVTSKLQITLPKRIAEAHGIQPGDEIAFESAGDVIRIVHGSAAHRADLSAAERLRLFDEASRRQQQREAGMRLPKSPPAERGWRREDLYARGKDE